MSPVFVRFKRHSLIASAALLAGFAWGPATARDLTVAISTDAVAVPARARLIDDLFRPFATAPGGVEVKAVTWAGGVDGLMQGAGEWDLVMASPSTAQAACDKGLLEKLDWTAIGGRDNYSSIGSNDCAVGAFASAILLTWEHEKLPSSPGWAEFWDIARYPGKRGLRKSARGNLEIALLADGVAAGDVYRILRTPDGVARAFRKLDQLRPYLVFWTTGAEAVRFLTSGDVLMTSAPSVAIAAALPEERQGFAMQWTGSLTTVQSWSIPKAAENATSATRLLAFLSNPALQSRLPQTSGIGGLLKLANDGLPPDQQSGSPTFQANLDKALLVDGAFWRDNGDKLSQQFDAWLAH